MKITKKTKNLAKTSQFFPFGKTLGKSHTANQHKQGVPEAQGRNDVSPFKGIDTCHVFRQDYFLWQSRNDVSPFKGIDTSYFTNFDSAVWKVEMMLARLRALTPNHSCTIVATKSK